MRRSAASLAALSLLAFASACRDGKQSLLPTDPAAIGGASRALTPGTCTTLSQLNALTRIVFASGGPNANSVLGKLDNLDKLLTSGKLAEAQAQARNIVSFIEKKAADGSLAGTHTQVQGLISGILCYAGLPTDSFLIYPTDQPQIIISPTGQGGVSLQANTVGTPSLLTITVLDPNAPSPLITKLDKYPANIELTISSPLTKPAIVAVCPALSVPASVLPRLRLGHQASTGFELTPRADGSFLTCQGVAQSRVPEWVQRLASYVMPKTLYAKQIAERGGGVGGTSTEFSPFGPVDPELRAGGVGGTSTEFLRTPVTPPTVGSRREASPRVARSSSLAPSARTNALSVTCTSASAPAGSALPPECRPAILITTANGTIMQNVPVNWAVNLGGGAIAPQNRQTSTCGAPFGATAATATDVNGHASVCWTLGATAGTNTVIATPSAGGDAPLGVTFAPTAQSFTATATSIMPTVTVSCPATATYTGSPLTPCTATATAPGLNEVLTPSYTSNLVVGTATATATRAAGNGYLAASGSASFGITQASATATAGSGTMTLGGAIPPLPCSISGLAAADAGAVTCTSTPPATLLPGDNVTTPTLSPANPPNYTVQPVSGTLAVRYAQMECLPSPLHAALPPTTTFVTKGTTFRVRCVLQTATGAPVVGVSGNLLVSDLGVDGLAAPQTVLSVSNAFSLIGNFADSYSYSLSTSPATFVTGHYFMVTASWNDGSTTTGYFYLQ